MTDWFEMVESMRNAMSAVEKAHSATIDLKQKADAANVKKFQDEMMTLTHHLEQMQKILSHNDTYSIDELAEAFSKAMGTEQNYHRIERYNTK